ncbi:hypothetical protein BHM03_00016943 [Ensete ventricosum]|nr:hypothetical protein BHM03_00016943 [Ensete ventricosum]
MAGACERRHHPRRGHKGQPRGLGCRLQGRLLARAVANRGSARARRHCPPARCRPRAATPVTGAVPTPTTCSAAAHAGVMAAQRGQEGLRREVNAPPIPTVGARPCDEGCILTDEVFPSFRRARAKWLFPSRWPTLHPTPMLPLLRIDSW